MRLRVTKGKTLQMPRERRPHLPGTGPLRCSPPLVVVWVNLQLGELGLASQKAKNGISDEGPEMAVCLAKPLQTVVRAPLCVRK